MSALGLAVMIVLAAAAIWAVYGVQRSVLFHGYKEIKEDAVQLNKLLRGEMARFEQDLVIAGNFGALPAVVRFSQSENTPGLSLQMTAPATFDLHLSPRTISESREKASIRTGSSTLDSRFSAYTGQAVQAKIFVSDSAVLKHLEQLCCSSQTEMMVEPGSIELSEMLIPANCAHHVREHLESMGALAKLLRRMPGADAITIMPRRKERSWLLRSAIAVGAVVIVILLLNQPAREPSTIPAPSPAAEAVDGIAPADARNIPHLEAWQMVGKADLSYDAVQFLLDRELPVSGRVSGHFNDAAGPVDSAYLLSNSSGKRRVIIMSGKAPAYDAIYNHVALIAVIPKESLAGVEWITAPREAADGDGLLLVEDADDPTSSLVLLRHEKQTYAGHPANFTKIIF